MLQVRPAWWYEVALVAVGYWLYTLSRTAITADSGAAIRHARTVQTLQGHLGLSFERSLNHWVAAHDFVAQVMDYYYSTLHFVVTIGVLVWLYVARQTIYRSARTVLFGTTLLALAGFYLYPLAPPRLLPNAGYVDTLARFHTWGSLADPKVAEHSNQFAAMPSLHIAWALWCGVTLFCCARRTWVRLLGLAYPVGTFIVVIGTANHFVIDAVGGAIVLIGGFAITRLLTGAAVYSPGPSA
jgi:hypothetical protein